MSNEALLHLETGHQGLEALYVLIDKFSDGLEHGFFDISLSCEMTQARKRLLVINAGKKYLFTIPEDLVNEVNVGRLMGFERRNEE